MAHANKTKGKSPETALKMLFLDVELSPNIGFTWGRFEQNVIQFVKERQILSFAYNWLGEAKIACRALPMYQSYKKDPDNNKALIKDLHAQVCKADVIVGHNIVEFDEKMCNTDFLIHGLPPPPPHHLIDTLAVARKKFRFNSNRLDDLGERLGLGRKIRNRGFDMWLGCLRGDPKSWDEMVRYNIGDVRLLKKIYFKERPWITNHPKMAAFQGNHFCPYCHSYAVQRRGSRVMASGRVINRFQCNKCGGWCSGRYVNKSWVFV